MRKKQKPGEGSLLLFRLWTKRRMTDLGAVPVTIADRGRTMKKMNHQLREEEPEDSDQQN